MNLQSLSNSGRRKILLGITAALMCCLSTVVAAFGIGTCNPSTDICINISTDNTIALHTPIKSNLCYEINGARTQLPEKFDWLNPTSNYSVVNLPIDLLSKAQIKNLTYVITEINHLPVKNCRVKTAPGKKILAGILTIELSYNVQKKLFTCTTTK